MNGEFSRAAGEDTAGRNLRMRGAAQGTGKEQPEKGHLMDSAGFKTPVQERYFEDYVPGSVYEFSRITVEEAEIVASGRQFDPQLFHTDPEAAKSTGSEFHSDEEMAHVPPDKSLQVGIHRDDGSIRMDGNPFQLLACRPGQH